MTNIEPDQRSLVQRRISELKPERRFAVGAPRRVRWQQPRGRSTRASRVSGSRPQLYWRNARDAHANLKALVATFKFFDKMLQPQGVAKNGPK
jgi:hypothetical protein